MKKINAFTLIELIIGMIVGSIVMGICYSAFSMTSLQFLDYSSKREVVNDLMQFNSVFSNDFVNSKEAYFINNDLTLFNTESKLKYHFDTNYVLRKADLVIDTFNVTSSNITINYCSETKKDLINAFSFNLIVLGENQSMSYAKIYGAETLFN